VAHAALLDQIAGTAFAATAASGNTQFKLDVVKAHTGVRLAGDLAVGHSVADTNNHGWELALRQG
jgi:hypothetical protein